MTRDIATPRSAATVVVIRNGDLRPQIFMARRHSRAVFASHYVFPGGLLEPVDAEVHGRATGVTADEADAMIGVEAGGLDYYSAAIREAFEESSVLLARQANGQWAFNDGADQHEPIQSCRDQLNACELGWSDFLERNDFRPAYEALHYIAYWVTPRVQSKRFSTRFFLAEMPEGQSAVHDDGELTHSCWMTAAEILAAGERGDMKLMYPTMSTLRDIARYDSVESVIEWARERGKSGVARMLPAFVEIDGKDQVVLPGNPHYPADIDT